MLIGVLAVLWLAVLAPPLLRARAGHRRDGDFSDYYTSLSRLGRNHRAAYGVPSARQRAARRRAALRRRRAFATLLGAVGSTFVLAGLSGSRPLWAACGVSVAALLAYTALVAHFQRATPMPMRPLATVAYLPARLPTRELALRRTAGS